MLNPRKSVLRNIFIKLQRTTDKEKPRRQPEKNTNYIYGNNGGKDYGFLIRDHGNKKAGKC